MMVYRRLALYLKEQRGWTVIAFVCVGVYAVAQALFGLLAGPATQFIFEQDLEKLWQTPKGETPPFLVWLPSGCIDYLKHATGDLGHWILPMAVVGVAAIRGAAQTGQFYLFGRVAQHCLKRVRERHLALLLKHRPESLTRLPRGDLVNRLTSDAKHIEAAVFYGLAPLVRDALSLAVIVLFLFWSDPSLSVTLFVVGPLAGFSLSRFTRWLKKVTIRSQSVEGRLSSVAYETVAGFNSVLAFNAEHRQKRLFAQANDALMEQMRVSYAIRALRTPVMEMIGAGALAVLLFWVGRHGAENPGHYISYLALVLLMYDPLKKLGKVGDYLAAGQAAFDRLDDLAQPELLSGDKPLVLGSAAGLAIEFENITAGYRTRSKDLTTDLSLERGKNSLMMAGANAHKGEPVLQKFSFKIAPGQMVGIAGPSGGGKSTLLKLLIRFLDPIDGCVRINQVPSTELSVRSVRSHLGFVEQAPFVFRDTIANNLRLAAPDASDQDIETALRSAQAWDFVEALPDGLNTWVHEAGSSLSGGQIQRLAIARALVRKPSLLLLDESTSQLDAHNEEALMRALSNIEATVLIVAHRLHCLRQTDHIIVIDQGQLVEQGTFEMLREQQGLFASMLAAQIDA